MVFIDLLVIQRNLRITRFLDILLKCLYDKVLVW